MLSFPRPRGYFCAVEFDFYDHLIWAILRAGSGAGKFTAFDEFEGGIVVILEGTRCSAQAQRNVVVG
jgi:hypothetical protein